jgi:ribosomal protein S18 acetylase RimI-like enzyme
LSQPAAPGLDLRPATESDHPVLVGVIDDWFGGRRVRHLLPRAWLRHFGSTSLVARTVTGTPIGFLVGFHSADRPPEAVIQLLAVHPSHRRRGVGRALVAAFTGHAAAAGRTQATAVAWADDPVAAAFFEAVGFAPDDGPETRRLYGRLAHPDYDGDGEDRIVYAVRLGHGT